MQPPKDAVTPASGWKSLALAATEGGQHCQPKIVAIALVCLGVGTAHLTGNYGWRHGTLLIVGAALGIVLYHARFGFTYAFRAFVSTGDSRGIRAQMLMLAVATVLFGPILVWNHTVAGALAPASFSVLIGAFIFSIGMQLGGG
jgi:uncharacterized membrane protein YedE/YeeE